jgi:hypothetical protein
MMTLESIKSEEDIMVYIQGMLNDFKDGLADQNETEWRAVRLIIYLVKLDRIKNIHLREEPTTTQSPEG